jgi:hypothetical protein
VAENLIGGRWARAGEAHGEDWGRISQVVGWWIRLGSGSDPLTRKEFSDFFNLFQPHRKGIKSIKMVRDLRKISKFARR